MANQGWPNGGGGGEQVSSTARTSGRGSTNADAEFIRGSQIADPGGDCDPMGAKSDLFEPPGQLSTTDPI